MTLALPGSQTKTSREHGFSAAPPWNCPLSFQPPFEIPCPHVDFQMKFITFFFDGIEQAPCLCIKKENKAHNPWARSSGWLISSLGVGGNHHQCMNTRVRQGQQASSAVQPRHVLHEWWIRMVTGKEQATRVDMP
jgi:hypothetical protein